MSSRVPLHAFNGDVTALCIACLDDGTAATASAASSAAAGTRLLLAGIGSQLHIYELPSGRRRCCAAVLPDSVRVHGISLVPDTVVSDDGGSDSLLLAVHGGRHAALLRLSRPHHPHHNTHSPGADWRVDVLLRLPRFQHWTHDVRVVNPGARGGSDGILGPAPALAPPLLLAVALSDNSLQAFDVAHPALASPNSSSINGSGSGSGWTWRRTAWAECADRCLLFSAALMWRQRPLAQQQQRGQQNQEQQKQEQGQEEGPETSSSNNNASGGSCSGAGGRWLVAGGTVQLDVVVWAAPDPAPTHASISGGGGGVMEPEAVPALFRLRGHEGSIYR